MKNRKWHTIHGMGRYYLLCLVILLGASETISAKNNEPTSVIRTWTLPYPLALADTGNIDSTYINFAMRDVLYDYSICNISNGNILSPILSGIYFRRTGKTECLLANQYDPYVITPQDIQFFNTTTPYSTISYKKGFTTYHEDNDLQFLFTGNLNSKTNLGVTINYLNGAGHYRQQEGKRVNGALFGSYNGNRYSMQAAFTFLTLSNFENGGMSDEADIHSTLKPEDYPTRLYGMNGYRYLAGYINHYYSLTVERNDTVHYIETDELGNRIQADSIRIVYLPVTTFRHVLDINEQNRRYKEKQPQDFYDYTWRNAAATNDSASTLTIRNTLSVTFEEAFNKKLKFGATVYAYNECQRHLNAIDSPDQPLDPSAWSSPTDSVSMQRTYDLPDTLFRYTWTNNTFVGGELYKNMGKILKYGFGGDVCVLGAKIGEFQVNGHLKAGFRIGKDSMQLSAKASFYGETPDYYLLHYYSNHYRWHNDFTQTLRLRIGGQISYPTRWITTRLKFDYENLTNYIYFNYQGLPEQDKGNISVLSGDVQLNLTTPYVNWDNSVVYQYSSSYKLPLPTVALYSNLYYHGTWFKYLDTQIGVDIRYNTAYYAPLLVPATGQFRLQNERKVGNYPTLGVYANFYVRLIRLRFFAQYQHFNATFMNKEYFSMPGYPQNPDVFRAGLAWHFYR